MELTLCFGMEHSGLSRAEEHEDSGLGFVVSGWGFWGLADSGNYPGVHSLEIEDEQCGSTQEF